MSFGSGLERAGALGLAREVRLEGKRFVCFTAYSDADSQWQLGACDGVEVWQVGLSQRDVTDRSGSRKVEDYLRDISQIFEEDSLELLRTSTGLRLRVNLSSSSSSSSASPAQLEEFTLAKRPAGEGKKEVGCLLFSLLDRSTATAEKLKECQKRLSEAQKQKPSDGAALLDVPLRSGRAAVRAKRKPAGHSLVNPSSKKRKAATGVVFGEGDD